jgi:hypothetical protein
MGIFSKRPKKPTFSKFGEQHFREGVRRILWNGESLLADGFFEDGPDPMGHDDGLQGMFGANAHTYLAVTNWRIVLGYLANGNFSSHEYVDTEPQINKSGNRFLFTYTNPLLRDSGSPTFRSTYSVTQEVADAIQGNAVNKKPAQAEVTQIQLSRKSWGEGPLAELAKVKSGRDYMLIELCTACSGTMLAPDDIETSPEKGVVECGTCLRRKDNKQA